MVADSFSLGQLLQRYRQAAGLTQQELADRAGYSTDYIGKLERDQRRPPAGTLDRLANILGLTAGERRALQLARQGSEVMGIEPQPEMEPFIGRARELAMLDHQLAGVGPPLLLLAGESGIGKTRLLKEAGRRAPRGMTVIKGGSRPVSVHEPFAPILEALACSLERLSLTDRLRALEGCGWLVRLLPELTELGIGPGIGPLEPAQERRLLFRAVGRYLTNIAGPKGLLLLDDLQWASADTIDLLAALLYREAGSIRMVGTYRSTEVNATHPLAALIAELGRARLMKQVRLGPLTTEESQQLLTLLLGEEIALDSRTQAQVVERAGGVPFYLVSFAEGMRSGTLNSGGGNQIPADVVASVRQRITIVSEAAQILLHIAAVAGQRVLRSVLYVVARQPEAVIPTALEELCTNGLLREEGEDAYRIAHDLIQEVVLSELGAARRAALHGAIGRALEELFPLAPQQADIEQIDQLAYHFARADLTEKALVYLEQAGDAARAHGAQITAANYYRELVHFLDQFDRPRDRIRMRLKLGEVLTASGRYDEALTVLEQAGQFAATVDADSAAQVMAQMASTRFYRSTPGEEIERIQQLIAMHPEPSPGRAQLLIGLAQLLYFSVRYQESVEALEQAANLGRVLGDKRIVAKAEATLGMALLPLARFHNALIVLESAIPLATLLNDQEALIIALGSAGWAYEAIGKWHHARAALEQGLAIAQQHQALSPISFLLHLLGRNAFLQGEWKQAAEYLQRAEAISHELERSLEAPFPLLELGRLRLAEGNWEEARCRLEEAIERATANSDLQALCSAHQLLAEVDLRQGRLTTIFPRLQPLLKRLGRRCGTSALLSTLAWVKLELGEMAEAVALVEESLDPTLQRHGVVDLVRALTIKGMILGRQGRAKESINIFEEALNLTRQLPYPYAEANILYESGILQLHHGGSASARKQLEEALIIFRGLGTTKDIGRTEQVLAHFVKA